MTPTDQPEPMACAWCDGPVSSQGLWCGTTEYAVMCFNCGAVGPKNRNGRAEAVAAWNRVASAHARIAEAEKWRELAEEARSMLARPRGEDEEDWLARFDALAGEEKA